MTDKENSLEEQVKEAFTKGALAVTTINGRMAPWTPFGMELDPRKFSRGKRVNRDGEVNSKKEAGEASETGQVRPEAPEGNVGPDRSSDESKTE